MIGFRFLGIDKWNFVDPVDPVDPVYKKHLMVAFATGRFYNDYELKDGRFTLDTDAFDVGVTSYGACSTYCAATKTLYVATVDAPRINIYRREAGVWVKKNALNAPTSTGLITSIALSRDGSQAIIGMVGAPYLEVYDVVGDSLSLVGSPIGSPVRNVDEVVFDKHLDRFFVCAGPSIHQFDLVDGVWQGGAPFSIGGTVYDITISPDGTKLGISRSSAPFVIVYELSADGIGARWTDPVGGFAANSRSVAISSDNKLVILSHLGAPNYFSAWKTDGTKFTEAVTINEPLPYYGIHCTISSDDKHIAFAHYTTPFTTVYDWDGVTLTKNPLAGGNPNNNGGHVLFVDLEEE